MAPSKLWRERKASFRSGYRLDDDTYLMLASPLGAKPVKSYDQFRGFTRASGMVGKAKPDPDLAKVNQMIPGPKDLLDVLRTPRG